MKVSEQFREVFGDYLFHYTHRDNAKSILKQEKIYSCTNTRLNKLKPTFITTESSRYIDMQRGFNEYVFLVFTEKHPFIQKQVYNNIDIVSVSIDISILDNKGVVISDRVATDNNVVFYQIENAFNGLGIEKIKNDPDLINKVRKFEIMIPEYIDLKKFYKKRI